MDKETLKEIFRVPSSGEMEEARLAEREQYVDYFRTKFLDKYGYREDEMPYPHIQHGVDNRIVCAAVIDIRDQLDRVLYELRALQNFTCKNRIGKPCKLIVLLFIIYICYLLGGFR